MLVSTTFLAPRALAEACLALTDTLPSLSLDVGEDPANHDNYRYTFFLPPDIQDAFQTALDTLPASLFTTPVVFETVDTSIDYIAQNRAAFPPLTIGPFFVARNDEEAPEGLIKLDVMPNRAFGSGEHATTTGCLLAYTHLIQSGQTFAKGLDFGAGSGILAIAAAKSSSASELWAAQSAEPKASHAAGMTANQNGTTFLCIDIDAPSVQINNQNAALNGVQHLVIAEEGETPPTDKFNLIFANILLQPLLELSTGLTAALAPGGSLILSGFTTDQSEQIAACYTSLGLKNVWQHQHADWLAQIWQHA